MENPSITFDGTQYLVVWQGMSASESSIYGQLVSKSGQTVLSNPVIISSGTQNDENPSVAFDGTLYLVVSSENKKDISGTFVDTNLNIIKKIDISDRSAAGRLTEPHIAFSNYYDFETFRKQGSNRKDNAQRAGCFRELQNSQLGYTYRT